MKQAILDWTVDYGEGPQPCAVPHAWRQDVPVSWEGPASYRTSLDVPEEGGWLRFQGVSYAAEVFIEGEPVAQHKGIWDAWEVDLIRWSGRQVAVQVQVNKNGGHSYPVADVLSGFIPYLHHTFGGIFRPVWLTDEPLPAGQPTDEAVAWRDRPFSGVLHWGWYPEIGHPHASEEACINEIERIAELGFDHIKFCLWLPPHHYLTAMAERGLSAWIELPLWLPNADSVERQKDEMLRIVRQYRHHPNIVAWTVGCELGKAATYEWRYELVQELAELTRVGESLPYLMDSSGGAAMYGGDPREAGTIRDYHPYCDAPHYPPVLERMRPHDDSKPVVLGEWCDADVLRDPARIADQYWASEDEGLNAKGVRWIHELPRIAADPPEWSSSTDLQESSRSQCLFMRQFAYDIARGLSLDKTVLTGLRDTPISTAGVFDDFGEPRFTPRECQAAFSLDNFGLVPGYAAPWVPETNVAGWTLPYCCFEGDLMVHLRGCGKAQGEPISWCCGSQEGISPDGEIALISLTVGEHVLTAKAGAIERSWPISVFPKSEADFPKAVSIQCAEGTIPAPFFREACQDFSLHPIWHEIGMADAWHKWLYISGDSAFDPGWLDERHPGWKPLLLRYDTRTFRELPTVVLAKDRIITTLMLKGGLGCQPVGFTRNPVGQHVAAALASLLD